MKDFRSIWKARASAKNNNVFDAVEYAILRAISAKTNDKEIVAAALLMKTFSPSKKTEEPYDAIYRAAYTIQQHHKWNKKTTNLLGEPLEAIFDTDVEETLFLSIIDKIVDRKLPFHDTMYSYIFVSPTLSPEQVAVQAAHVTMVVGKALSSEVDPYEVHYVLIAETPEKVLDTLNDNHIDYKLFDEPGVGITAVSTMPIFWYSKKRTVFQAYAPLKFREALELV